MKSRKVVFVAYEGQDNLGVGYLSSMLLSRGFDVATVDFAMDNEVIFSQVKAADPLMVGFSLIFQFYLQRLQEVAHYLRLKGVHCHFTVGGHYPSLRYRDILDAVPELDSVVRFEGELTAFELAEKLKNGQDWRNIEGVAYRQSGEPHSNPIRPLIADLDALPFPLRNPAKIMQCVGINCACMLASRGCVWNCAFCSVRKFYGAPAGSLRRSRSTKNVVDEMKQLYRSQETKVFLFQDDDFFPPGKLRHSWAQSFVDELRAAELSRDVLWKISCRSDEVEVELFKQLRDAGLMGVYLGIESGNYKGLKLMNKRLTVEDNVNAVERLNSLGIMCEYGFMMFDPSSSFDSIRENLSFLRKISGDGNQPVVFCKMLPYAETDVEKSLSAEGRLSGTVVSPNYSFLEPVLDDFYEYIHKTFNEWMFTSTSLPSRLRWRRLEIALMEKYYPEATGLSEYKNLLRGIIASSNTVLFQVFEKAIDIFEQGKAATENLVKLSEFQAAELRKTNQDLYSGAKTFQDAQA
jgi:anaerobic magnesium-protoporphyrin IX monomethyl ester cyclase